MNVEHSAGFSRNLRQIPSAQLRRRLALKIEELEEASNIIEVSGVKRLRAEGRHYRVRIGDYRLGITMDDDVAVLRRFLPRRDFYRYFP
jgi:mRNA interferase RelE/StbE